MIVSSSPVIFLLAKVPHTERIRLEMEQNTALRDGFNAVMEHLESLKQCDYNKSRYDRAYEDITDYYETVRAMEYNADVNKAYRDNVKKRYEMKLISKKRYNYYTRLSFMLDSFYAGKVFEQKYSRGLRFKVQLDDFFQTQVDQFVDFLKNQMSQSTATTYASVARDFFAFLQELSIRDFPYVNEEIYIQFIKDEYASHTCSMNNVCCTTRKLAEYFTTQGYPVSLETITFKAAPTRREIYPALGNEELQTIIGTPDRDTVMGKRDYAVLLLASFTALRAIDIANLCFESYNSEQKTIYLTQHKTGTKIGLPIPDEVVGAIDDYVKHGRPKNDCPYIFLTMDRPYRKLSDISSVRNILLRQLKRSNLGYTPGTGRGFHIFRRTMGKWLLGASINPEMISQILGQRDGEVLKRYLPLTPDLMRGCALGFESAPLRTEVFG